MPETDDKQRLDRLLDAIVNKLSLHVMPKAEPTEEGLREDDEG